MTKHTMWFKTRVGLVSITEPTQILVHQHPKDLQWSIYVILKGRPEVQWKSFLGSYKATSPTSHLAIFSDRPNVGEAIGECMAKIEAAIQAKADFCDLSQAGDVEAWGKKWQQIQWPK